MNSAITSLSGGDSLSKSKTNTGNSIRDKMDDLLDAIIWKKSNIELSDYYKRLQKTISSTSKGDYWFRRNEIFARAFEVYVMMKLRKQAIRNHLLTGAKYNPNVYLKESEMETLIPKFDALLSDIRKNIK